MTTTFELHDPRTLGLETRLEVARLNAEAYAYANPDEPPLNPEVGAEDLLQSWGDERMTLLLAREGEQLIAQGRLSYDLKQNTDKGNLHVVVRPGERRRSVGRQIVARLAQEALKLNRTSYYAATSSRSPDGEAFLAALGARASLPSIISELYLKNLDQAMLQRWVTRPEGDPYRLHRFQHVPEHELGRVANVYDVMNTAPRGDLEFEDWVTTPEHIQSQQTAYAAIGGKTLLYVVEHLPTEQFVAFSQVGWHPTRAALIDQWGTGVHPDHRGQGLGKWVKAAVLQDLPAHNPEGLKIYTGNADVNAAMLGINRALGYAPAFNRIEWQGQTQDILAAVSANA
ncbi:GNAT family N-acetyltransferase [Deinococcus ruber]|uniref:GNAT family N-acetyltransferase n=1 Tax=Deinococcus ruber TaxID=1848197 RepID=A0A918F2Y7_9DEIO|nr:GNAT family N-acetyltransferase [Deinococcus ruber]GGQ99899.1 GNAT family N-acetyltransferase [Deinococcus ruber]